jgi:hypothetical protein
MGSFLVLGLAISVILAAFAWAKRRGLQAVQEVAALKRAAERAALYE